MPARVATLVSKRSGAPILALMCLMMAQLLVLASCDGEHDLAPMAAKVAVGHR